MYLNKRWCHKNDEDNDLEIRWHKNMDIILLFLLLLQRVHTDGDGDRGRTKSDNMDTVPNDIGSIIGLGAVWTSPHNHR